MKVRTCESYIGPWCVDCSGEECSVRHPRRMCPLCSNFLGCEDCYRNFMCDGSNSYEVEVSSHG